MTGATLRPLPAAAVAAVLAVGALAANPRVLAFPVEADLPAFAALRRGSPPHEARPRQAGPAASPGLRLYILDCGTLKDRDGVPYGLTLEQVPPRDLADPCALVVHPRGTLLWETGLHESVNGTPAAAEARPGRPRAGDRVDKSLRSQLQQAGYAPADISYVAVSHAHWDHTGNLRDYAQSTWLVQRAERDSIFGATPLPNQADFAGFDRIRTQILDGDHDVFGDGTVMTILAPGHTAGHQVLLVGLPRTGAVILSGDLYHFAEELTIKPAPAGRNAAQIAASKAKVQELIAATGAQLWIQHDRNHYATLKKAPAFYD